MKIKYLISSLFTIGLITGFTSETAQANQLLINGGFETGDFTGWTQVTNSGSGNCSADWTVLQSDTICNLNNTTLNSPIEGEWAAFNSFDSGSSGTTFTIEQDFILETGSIVKADLSWAQSYGWDFSFGNVATQERIFKLDILDSSDNLIGNAFELMIGPDNGSTDFVDWENQMVDISNLLDGFGGQTLTLVADVFIPESSTGPATFGLDNISLDVEVETAPVPEPGTILGFITAMGLGFAAKKGKNI